MPDVFDIARIIKQFIPPHKQVELQDHIIDILAKAFPDERWHNLILAYRSDAAFQDSLAKALKRAIQRFVVDYPDKELVHAVTRDTHFWDVPSTRRRKTFCGLDSQSFALVGPLERLGHRAIVIVNEGQDFGLQLLKRRE